MDVWESRGRFRNCHPQSREDAEVEAHFAIGKFRGAYARDRGFSMEMLQVLACDVSTA